MKIKFPAFLILMAAMAISAVNPVWSQEGPGDVPLNTRERTELRQDIENLRIWRLTRYLDLSPEQSEKFFPIYNEFRENRDDLEQQKVKLVDRIGNAADLPDYPEENLVKMLDELDDIMLKQSELHRDFRKKALKVLSVHQVAKIAVFEHRFQREIQRLVREARERRMMHGPPDQRR